MLYVLYWLPRYARPIVYPCIALLQLLYRRQHQSRKLWIPSLINAVHGNLWTARKFVMTRFLPFYFVHFYPTLENNYRPSEFQDVSNTQPTAPLSSVPFTLVISTATNVHFNWVWWNLYCSPSIIEMIISRHMGWEGHVARLGLRGMGGGKPERKRPLGRPRGRWVDNIKIDFR
jgi:hypothetical protein